MNIWVRTGTNAERELISMRLVFNLNAFSIEYVHKVWNIIATYPHKWYIELLGITVLHFQNLLC